jgi:hypothetical protein
MLFCINCGVPRISTTDLRRDRNHTSEFRNFQGFVSEQVAVAMIVAAMVSLFS